MEKPNIREMALKNGISYATDTELIMLILGRGTKGNPITVLAKKITETLDCSNNENLLEALLNIKGIGKSKALAIAAAIEFGRRKNCHIKALIKQPKDVIPFVKHYAMQDKEHFLCISLNGAHEIIQIRVVSVGCINQTLIQPREVFADAIMEHASAIILCHNHPSGNVNPSQEDIKTSKILYEASKLLGINILDHIIIGIEKYYSFLEHSLIF
ncbi:MAG: DNA repair protein RadC [Treponema sp.]|nr:DNA repair protein RadC [Treponema sp.]